jgi:hypothetical protein
LVKTIFLPNFIGKRHFYEKREDAVSKWVGLADPASMDQTELDAISGATPDGGHLTYTWDLTDQDGKPMKTGKYQLVLEGTLYWDSEAIFTADIDLSDPDKAITLREDRSTPDVSVNEGMIRNVTASTE